MISKFGLSLFISACLLTLLIGNAQAQFHAASLPMETRWELVDAGNGKQPQLVAVLHIDLENGWHTYAHEPGDLGTPTELKAQLAGSQQMLPVLYPKGATGKDVLNPQFTVNTYGHSFKLFIPLPQTTATPLLMKAQLNLLLCSSTTCMPGKVDIPLRITSLPNKFAKAQDQQWWPQYQNLLAQKKTVGSNDSTFSSKLTFSPSYLQPALEVTGIISAIFFGIIAGLILNVMPCVLPVVSIKLSSLMSSSLEEESCRAKTFREHNIFFSTGVLVWFAMLALLLGATGQTWGIIFQSPKVVMVLTAIVFLLSLSLFGLFSLPIVDLKIGTHSDNPRAQAFFTGILATLLATPCSGPFLGGVLGWTLTQSPPIIMAVFLSIGIGMTAPYLCLAIWPSLVRFVPRPGPWVKYVEKGVGFFLLGTCIYLINILPQTYVVSTLLVLWCMAPAAWIFGLATPEKTTIHRLALRIGAFCIIAISLTWLLTPPAQIQPQWKQFDQKKFSQQLGNKVLFVDFTADWCPTCKVLERTVLTNKNIAQWKKDYAVEFIKVDLTESNPDGEKLLQALGAKSIPTAAVFPLGQKAKQPQVLRDLFTKTQLENLLKSYTK